MKTKVGLLFGGRSVENEISVVTAVQTSESLDADRYEGVPIYISKQGRWYTGDGLLKVENYRDLTKLLASSSEVYMKPLYGDYNLYLNGHFIREQKDNPFRRQGRGDPRHHSSHPSRH